MNKNISIKLESIKPQILENFLEYVKLFLPIQSDFLCGLYKRYQSLDNGVLVLYFAKKTHQAILRKKESDLSYDLSFEKFWHNHSESTLVPETIMNIARDADLPKETARRKLTELIKQKILTKKNRIISWMPSNDYKNDYNNFVSREIKNMAKLTNYVTNKIDLDFTVEQINEEYKKRFSFYWFHYLDSQIKWMKMWKKQFNDLEIALIFIQFSVLLSSKYNEEKKITHSALYEKPNFVTNANLNRVSVSATSVSDITGIPRATCIRKLNTMVQEKILSQDKNNKRYFIIPEAFKGMISKKLTDEAAQIFSEFYFISIKALNTKI